TTGTIINNVWKQELYNQIDANPAAILYTPTWGAVGGTPGTIGNGQLFGRYTRQGQLVAFTFRLLVGSTTTLGSGVWLFSLPPLGTPLEFVLSAELLNSAVGQYPGIAVAYNATDILFVAAGAPNGV